MQNGLEGHKARKRFGQNFLHDEHWIGRIIATINPQAGDTIVEIGPGQAALTRHIIDAIGHETAVEIDRDLAAWLQETFADRLTLIEADALKLDWQSVHPDKRLRVIGNLPYNISSPLLFHLMSVADRVIDQHFMLQKEVVERLGAGPSSADYGRLTVMVQYLAQVIPLLIVPPQAFRPRPKVTSAVVRLKPKALSAEQRSLVPFMSEITRTAFSARRKTIRNALSSIFSAEDLESNGLNLQLRPEDLRVDQYVLLAQALKHKRSLKEEEK